MNPSPTTDIAGSSDVVLVGSGIMSASLGTLLKGLDPRLSIRVFEVTPELAREASDGWNNAGTGHAGLCELSYTPTREPDGSVKIGRALSIFEQFEHSKQFWAHAVESGMAGPTADFIHAVPHICFVQGTDDVELLRARDAALREHHFFRSSQFTTEPTTIGNWAPLVMEGRGGTLPVAATRIDGGTEVNFGLLARQLLGWPRRLEAGCVAEHHADRTQITPSERKAAALVS